MTEDFFVSQSQGHVMLTKVADSADYGLKLPFFVKRQTNEQVASSGYDS